MAPHSKIPWTEEPGGLQSLGSRRVWHDWATSLSLFSFMHCKRKWQLTPVFLPGESQGRGSLVGCRLWGHTESDTTEATLQQQQQIQRLLLQSFVLFFIFFFSLFLLCRADVEECVPKEFFPGEVCLSVGLQGLHGCLFGRSLPSVCGGLQKTASYPPTASCPRHQCLRRGDQPWPVSG